MPAVQPVCVKLCVCVHVCIYICRENVTHTAHRCKLYNFSHTINPGMDKCRYTIKPDYISTCACMARWHNVYIIGTSL